MAHGGRRGGRRGVADLRGARLRRARAPQSGARARGVARTGDRGVGRGAPARRARPARRRAAAPRRRLEPPAGGADGCRRTHGGADRDGRRRARPGARGAARARARPAPRGPRRARPQGGARVAVRDLLDAGRARRRRRRALRRRRGGGLLRRGGVARQRRALRRRQPHRRAHPAARPGAPRRGRRRRGGRRRSHLRHRALRPRRPRRGAARLPRRGEPAGRGHAGPRLDPARRLMPDRLYYTDSDEANALIAADPLALLIGLALDQQVTVQKAFAGPLVLRERLGALDAAQLAATDLEPVFRERPAIHRFPGSMAKRVRDLAAHITERYDGDAARVWTDAATPEALRANLEALPGFGEMKVRTLAATSPSTTASRPPSRSRRATRRSATWTPRRRWPTTR